MMVQQSLLLILLFIGHIQGQFRNLIHPTGKQSILRSNDDPGEPLFLTPYLEQGKIDEARRLR
jgi:hypothetical protein